MPRPRRGRVYVAAALVLAAIVGATGWALASRSDTSNAEPSPTAVSSPGVAAPGEAAPPFVAPGLHGGIVDLADYAGQPVVISFWASWCAPCRKEFPLFRDALRRHQHEFALIGVAYQDLPRDARAFAKEHHATWPLATDQSDAVARQYGVRALPQTIFVNRDGTITQRFYGAPSRTMLDRALAKIIKH